MRSASILIAAALLSPICYSADIWVPDDYTLIQDAINAAVDGDMVIVRPGTYVENIDFVGKAITVKSEMGADVTVIDGNQAGSVVVFQSGEKELSTLEGFTLTNGYGVNNTGGGITCKNASPTISNNTILGNKTDGNGGGIYCIDSSPEITNNTIKDNSASFGCGGVYCDSSSPRIAYNTLTGNMTGGPGGGIFCYSNSHPTIANNVISRNTSDGSGGGIYCYCYSSPTITGNIIFRNSAYHGAGIFCYDLAFPTIINNLISENKALWFGGGIEIYNLFSITVSGNIITGNTANFGGGISCFLSSFTITNNIISSNTAADSGGGIRCEESSLTITNNTVTGNTANNNGGGIYCFKDSSPRIANTILWDNGAPSGRAIWIGTSADPVDLTISYSDVEGGKSSCHVDPNCTLNWGTGMIDADPLFLDPANGDFHIPFDSHCRSAGDRNAPNLPDTDFEGDPRTGLFAFPDIGADEFHTHFYVNGIVSSGSNATGVIIGWPKTNPVMLISGSEILPTPDPTPYGDLWLMPPWEHRVHFNPMPDNGVRIIDRVISTGLPPGTQIPFQALVGTELSNLWVVDIE